jgi:dolichol kinase
MEIYYFYIWFLIILVSHFSILFLYTYFSTKEDILNNVFGFGALFFVLIHIPMFLLLMFQDRDLHKFTLPLFLDSVLIPLLLIGFTMLLSTIFLFIFKLFSKSKNFSAVEKKISIKLQSISKTRKDLYRKIWHILIFIGLFVIWFISYDFVFTHLSRRKKPKIDPKTTNMLYLYIRILTKPNSIENVLFSLEWFYYVLFFFFYIFCLIMLINEFTRKTRYLGFPLNFIPTLLLSEEEKEKYGTYLYFAIGHMFAAFICPPMAFFAILAMSSIGDLIPSQIGMRYGKLHIPWNTKKTWEGTFSGTVISFILCYFFIGFIYAFIFAVSFMCIDLFTRKPLDVSDNLLIPIGCALVFLFIRFYFDFTYDPIILELL